MDAQPVAAHPNLSRLPPLEVRLWARPERLRSELYFLAARGDARTLSERLALSGGAGGRLDLAWSDMGKGRTALWVAAYYGEEECVRLLVQAGAPVDQPNVNGATPLWVACQGGFERCAAVLLEAGADAEAPTNHGPTPMLAAVAGDHVGCLRRLLTAGADATAEHDERGMLDWAVELGAAQCAALLRETARPTGHDANLKVLSTSDPEMLSHKMHRSVITPTL